MELRIARIAFVADPLESLDASIDTTVGLMHAAQDRGTEVWVTEAGLLEAVNGRARALARRLRLPPSRPAGGHTWSVAGTWFSASEPKRVWLDEMAAVFMRTEPPVDRAYTTATLILDLLDPARTALVNDPRGLRVCSEHLLPLRYPDLIPPTVVTADPRTVRSFLADHGTAVVKPVDGCSGPGRAAAGPARPQSRVAHRGLHPRRYPRHRRPAVPARGIGRQRARGTRRVNNSGEEIGMNSGEEIGHDHRHHKAAATH